MTDFDRTYAMLPDDLVEHVIKTEYTERPPAAGDSAEAPRTDPNRERVKGIWAAAMASRKFRQPNVKTNRGTPKPIR